MNEKIFLKLEEKKVEYIELIYDLVFVYIIGRNNQLLHHIQNGFVERESFLAYLMCTLAVIQIWNFSTYYINLYGRNSVREHVYLFINMFLLYFLAEGTRVHWQSYHKQYHVAWALILVNIAVQYLIEMRHHKNEPADITRTRRMAVILFVEAALVLADIPMYQYSGTAWLSMAAIAFGIMGATLFGQRGCPARIDFSHLSERAMLFVVFTFGEMIIGISSYFEGEINAWNLYFSFMAFMIVVGLFLSYELIYDHLIDRGQMTNGLFYIGMHIPIIFALNNTTASLEFMREEEVDLVPKVIFIIVSLIMYYAGLMLIGRHAKEGRQPGKQALAGMTGMAAVFAVLMIVTMRRPEISVAVTVLYVFVVYFLMRRYKTSVSKQG